MNWELRRNALIIRWAYLWAGGAPYRTSLCRLFWRTVLITPLKLLGCAACVAIIGAAIYVHPWRVACLLVGLALLVAICASISWLEGHPKVQAWSRRREDRRHQSKSPSVLIHGFRAVKAKMCPIVDLVDR